MPKPVRQGYFIKFPRKIKIDAGKSAGIYLHRGGGLVWIDYAGLEGRQPLGMKMSRNPSFLREIAKAFEMMAGDIEGEP